MLPEFDEDGYLPPGIHEASWEEFSARFGGSERRAWLLEGLRKALIQLQSSGCKRAFIDGSFVTSKEEPEDYDGCWDPQGVNPHILDDVFLDFSNGRFKQKTKYRGEFFISNSVEQGAGLCFLEFFQMRKESFDKKGIVLIRLGGIQ